MANLFLISPDLVKQRLLQRFRTNRRQWLEGFGTWPLSVPLGIPTERQAREHLGDVQAWQSKWHAWRGEGEVVWVERRWQGIGSQRLPERLLLNNPLQVSAWVGEAERWQRASYRYSVMTGRWPLIAQSLSGYFEEMADYSEEDFLRLIAMLEWLEGHPDSGLYIRQIPVKGVDTKWLLSRKAFVADLLRALSSAANREGIDFYGLAGIRREPLLLRLRVLDPESRRSLSGLGDISAPLDEIARMQLALNRVYIVENLHTGLAFEDIVGAAVFMRLGYAVDLFGQIPWLKQLPCYYWGDLDTHGFAILNRLRHYLPHAQSLLMDATTLLRFKDLWVSEKDPVASDTLTLLSSDEQQVYKDVCSNRWGRHIRLEQERIPWQYAQEKLLA